MSGSGKISGQDLFDFGLKITLPGQYFQPLELINHFINFPHPSLQSCITSEIESLGKKLGQTMSHITNVQVKAESLCLIIMPPPRYPEAFFPWAKLCISEMNRLYPQHPSNKILFEAGCLIGESISLLALLVVIVHLSEAVAGVPAFEVQWKNTVKDMTKRRQQAQKLLQEAHTTLPFSVYPAFQELMNHLSDTLDGACQAVIDFNNPGYLMLLSQHTQRDHQEIERRAEKFLHNL